eukprot:TRINITY_DN71612_c0_g1_i1.p2 TRINITY_DN71612_c0_g1~~TRINITY_DN71612_c0_g1_i1.p2  ORF type:complete len:577 (+),score=109.24 TRINITY_DN71612_c0_g1_i1:101-1831(+)
MEKIASNNDTYDLSSLYSKMMQSYEASYKEFNQALYDINELQQEIHGETSSARSITFRVWLKKTKSLGTFQGFQGLNNLIKDVKSRIEQNIDELDKKFIEMTSYFEHNDQNLCRTSIKDPQLIIKDIPSPSKILEDVSAISQKVGVLHENVCAVLEGIYMDGYKDQLKKMITEVDKEIEDELMKYEYEGIAEEGMIVKGDELMQKLLTKERNKAAYLTLLANLKAEVNAREKQEYGKIMEKLTNSRKELEIIEENIKVYHREEIIAKKLCEDRTKEYKALREKYLKIRKELDENMEKSEKARKEYKEYTRENETLDKSIKQMRSEHERLNEEVRRLENQNKQKQSELKSHVSFLEQCAKHEQLLSVKCKDKSLELSELSADLNTIHGSIKAKVEKYGPIVQKLCKEVQEISELREEKRELEGQIEAYRKKVYRYFEDEKTMKEREKRILEYKEIEKKHIEYVNDSKMQLSILLKQCEEAKKGTDEFEKKYKMLFENVTEAIKTCENECFSLKVRSNQIRSEYEEYKDELKYTKDRCSHYRAELQRLEIKVNSLCGVLLHSKLVTNQFLIKHNTIMI